jgi:hypothetical protein
MYQLRHRSCYGTDSGVGQLSRRSGTYRNHANTQSRVTVFLKNQGIPISERQFRALKRKMYRPRAYGSGFVVSTAGLDVKHCIGRKKLAAGWVDRHCVTELPRATLGKQGGKTSSFVVWEAEMHHGDRQQKRA